MGLLFDAVFFSVPASTHTPQLCHDIELLVVSGVDLVIACFVCHLSHPNCPFSSWLTPVGPFDTLLTSSSDWVSLLFGLQGTLS